MVSSLSASLESGLGTVFWAIAGISVASAITSLFFPRIPIAKAPLEGTGIAQPAEMSAAPPEA